ncbi:MAG: class I SAM-dependent DNA methyltransferase [Ferrovum myxofaciens]
MNQQALSSLIWSVADLLRGDFKPHEYGHVILPFTVLRRLDCVLAPTKAKALVQHQEKKGLGIAYEPFVQRAAGQTFFNVSDMDLPKILGDQDHLRDNLLSYIQGFSDDVRDIFSCFDFPVTLDRLHKANLLYLVTEKFTKNLDLHPESIDNYQMGLVFEELLRKFSEMSNETAGEHYTPREVIRLMVELLFIEDDEALSKPGIVRTIYDPTAGTGGMLSVAEEHLHILNQDARLSVFGQELNDESYAICKADMLIKGQDAGNIIAGNTLSDDGHPGKRFDYMLSNPPFGVEWKKVEKEVRAEHEGRGMSGRFGPGLPRVSDGSLLFLMHLLSKMRPAKEGGSRIGIVLNGSPLFTGGAGSGESEIRRHLLENDLVEAIVGLPTDMFFNTGISTYVWIITNRKAEDRQGKVQLIDASGMFQKMRKSLGSKRKELGDQHIKDITRLLGDFLEARQAIVIDKDGKEIARTVLFDDVPIPQAPEGGRVKHIPVAKILHNEEFGYRTITVERPLRDDKGNAVLSTKGKNKGKVQADSALRDTENVPLSENVETYFNREVQPHVSDAWIDTDKCDKKDGRPGIVGYEIPFNRHFYVFEPPRELAEIDAELKLVTDRIKAMIEGLSA